jgi:hypothetical protein
MAFLFPKSKSVKMPSLPAVPEPPSIREMGPEPGDWQAKLAKRRRGFARTVLTGELAPTLGGKSLLGD